MKWSVALFGYHKHRYELRENKQTLTRMPTGTNYQGRMLYEDVWTNKVVGRFVDPPTGYDEDIYFVYEVTGWERRARPGDIIAVKPIEEAQRWTPTERKEFLIVTLDSIEREQIPGLLEPVWDTDSYPDMNIDWETVDEETVSLEFRPKMRTRKRRFSIPLQALEEKGVDIASMLDPSCPYVPNGAEYDKLECYDNLDDKNIEEADGLNLLPPIVINRPEKIWLELAKNL